MQKIWAAVFSSLCWVCSCTSLVVLAQASSAKAQESQPTRRLVVLHRGGDGVPAELRAEIDRLVLTSVARRVRVAAAYGSKVPFEDVELAAGCTSRGPDCMRRIAGSLAADWVMVRELTRHQDGQLYLTLIAHDGPRASETRRAVALLGAAPRDPLHVVPLLIERLYPKSLGEPRRDPPRGSSAPVRVVGWTSEPAAGVSEAVALLHSDLWPRLVEHSLQAGRAPMRAGAAAPRLGAWRGGY